MIRLVVVDWEGGEYRYVGPGEWWRFVTSPPERLCFTNPGRIMAAYQAKCFAGVMWGNRGFGYDFVIPRWRKRRPERKIRAFVEWRCVETSTQT